MNAVRRLRAGLRGWGGVGAMAVLCALTLVFALVLPVKGTRGDGAAGTGAQGVARGTQARADECTDATSQDQSLRPSRNESGPTIAEIEKRGYLRIGIDQNSFRWGYRDPNNTKADAELEGFDIDLAHRIAEEILGDRTKVRFRAVPTNQRVHAIQEKQVDMVVRTMTINCDRMADVAFSQPYFRTGQQLLAPKSSTIKGYDKTLANKTICTAATSTAWKRLTADEEKGSLVASAVIYPPVPNQLDCLVRLQLGEVDAVVTDGALAASQAAQDPTVDLKGEPFTTEYYGVAMNLDADDLVRRVNQVLVDYLKDGWQDSYDAWLSGTLGDDSAQSRPPSPQQYRD
ncbi:MULTISPECIES: glutamate ABC transporter substrate-binding protein [unclassified Streptomyces]|uniref:glutamate ABC transporter substrate-binding protein n=1 Tax=unclassified Streptomyces TaxID=2593676 RepID=UPI002E7A8AAD|nr:MULTISPECIES: glutamate ABC transporter substrate-binding protein [unclassified Streptomyces]MEE1766026.1 glutamate ABC transporter substrate-binding protein [Streptomyces sp. SP18BB07]MEE1834804.1 glutamate ABC transporter substrate-binding protein [Streptomyces sp. SP17KL33]